MKQSKSNKPTKATKKPCPSGFYRNKKGICVQASVGPEFKPWPMKTKDLDTLLENEYAYEPPIQIIPKQKIMTPEAERFNGWAAMLGFVAAVGAYVTTGQIIPGIF